MPLLVVVVKTSCRTTSSSSLLLLLLCVSAILLSSSALSLQQQQRQRKTTLLSSGETTISTKSITTTTTNSSRREWLQQQQYSIAAGVYSSFFVFSPLQAAQATSTPPYNPLNLKGTFWETGELYVKKDNTNGLPTDPAELLPAIEKLITALESLEPLVLDGKFDDLSRQLRSGSPLSESQLRLLGYALLDQLPEDGDNDNKTYLSERAFRLCLNQFIQLDTVVQTAARQQKLDGGLVETLGRAAIAPLSVANELSNNMNNNMKKNKNDVFGGGGSSSGDSRIQVLASLGETTKAFKAFVKAANDALQ